MTSMRSGNPAGDVTLERPLPHNQEAERAVLGAILLNSSLCNQAVELLKVEDFFFESHRRIFEKMLVLSETGRAIDHITLKEELARAGELEQVGGMAFVASLLDGAVRISNIEEYAKIIKGKSVMRRLITVSNQIIHSCLDQENEPDELLDNAEKMIFQIAEDRIRTGFVSIAEVARKQLELVEKMAERPQMMTGVPTGFTELDRLTNGFQPSDLIIIAARPSAGKCLAYWSLIDDPQTGARLTIEDYVKQRLNSVFGLSVEGAVRETRISDWIDSGIKRCYLVKTRTGREVAVTGHHPFFTVDGWKPLNELQVGSAIAVPRALPVFGNDDSLPIELVRLLAYYIAEGGLTSCSSPRFSITDPVIVDDFKKIIAKYFPDCAIRVDGHGVTYQVARPRRAFFMPPNPVGQWLSQFGLMGKLSKEKFFPACVWQWSRAHLAEFLRAMMSCDGSINQKEDYIRIEFSVASQRLAADLHHAFVRFGIISKFYRTSKGAWRVEISEFDSIKLYQEEIGWIGEKSERLKDYHLREMSHPSGRGNAPKETWTLVRAAAASQGLSLIELARRSGETEAFGKFAGFNPHTNRAITTRRLAGYAEVLSDNTLKKIAHRDIYWDEIVSIDDIGEHQVYDLTVPDGANFIAQDICVHNTALGLTIAQNSAIAAQKVIGVFSLEMTKESLVSRMLCSEAHVDAHRLRGGFLNREEWARLAAGLQKLAEARIYIDDTPGVSILEMRAKARRLKAEHGLDMLIVDYLQLMRGRGRNESRQQEVSQISRDLKGLAKELNVPLIALSQLSRAPETRTDHKPQLSDLRESGCISGESLVTLAETGARVPIASLVGRSGFKVWALNEATMKLEAAVVSRAFATGRKPVYRLKTRLGREVRATANHKFRSFQGWRRLDELQVGDRLALPRIIPSSSTATMTEAEAALLGHLIGDGCTLPRHTIQYTTRELELAERVAELAKEAFGNRIAPRINPERKWYQVYLSAAYKLTHGKHNPVTDWLTELGAFGYRSYEKFVPARVFEQPAHIIAVFLRHLWATDGCIQPSYSATNYPSIYYASSSERLARDVQSLLLRLGINAVLRVSDQGNKGRPQFHVLIMGREDILAFADRVGAVSEARKRRLTESVEWVQARVASTNRDVIPREAWQVIAVPAMAAAGITQRQMQAALENAYWGTSIYKNNIGRERTARLAEAVRSHELATLAVSDVYWDEIIAIESDGEEDVYDLTVEKHHNFIADNIYLHNSIEQDADVVLFIYREEMYNPTEENAGIAEIIIGKQRNGPTDTVRLAFIKQFTRFENLWREG